MSMQQEVYEAFRELGVSEDKALKAATALGRREVDMSEVKRKLAVHDWVLAAILAFQIAIFVKLFVH